MACALFTGETQAQVIKLISAPGNFFVDDKSGNGIVYNYAAYTISNNTAATLPTVYVAITNIVSTNRIVLATTDPGVHALGALLPGQAKMAAFYLKGPSFIKGGDSLTGLTNENHTIQVLNGPPGVGSVLVSSNYSFTNITYVIEAGANKVTIITNLNPYAVIGEEVQLVIGGETGTIGGQNTLAFSPAVFGSWRPDAYELRSCVMRFTQNPTYANLLYFDPGTPGFTNFSGQSYTNTFTFRAIQITGTNIEVSPFAFIDSGINVKHTALTSLTTSGGSNVIASATNAVIISSQTVVPSSILAPGGTVTYSITFSNSSAIDVVMDEIIDMLPGVPANVTFVPGSATYNSLSLGNPDISGQTLAWPTPFPVNANSSSVLTFQATAPLQSGQYTNSVIAIVGSVQIDTTLDTTDNSPSRSVFTVVPVADLAVSKSAPASVYATTNFNYTISVTNLGPSPADSLSVTDALPAGVTFVSASPIATLNGDQVIWTNLGILATNTSTNLTITVTAPADGAILTNTAAAGSPTTDLNSTNNTSPLVFTTVTPIADAAITKIGPASAVLPGANFDYTVIISNSGPSIASSVTVTDSLPANVIFFSATGGGVLSGDDVVWEIASLAAGASSNFTLTVTAPLKGGITNVASVGGATSDPNPTNNITPPVTTTVSNLPPVAVNDTAATTNTPVSIPVLVNDSDPNGDTLTIVGVSFTNGTAIISGTNVIFTPDTNFTGYVTVVYAISDGNGGTNSAIITVAVGVVNQPPIAMNDSTNTLEDASVTINVLANDSDPNGDTLTIVSFVSTNGSVINTGTNLVFSPAANFNGTVTIGYTISDGFGGTNSAVITVTVTPVNDAPVAVNDNTNTLEDASVTIDALANDSDVDGDTLAIVSFVSTNGTVINTGTNLVFTPDTNFNGTVTILYTISDGNGGTNSAVITVTVDAVNDPPVAVDDSYSVNGTTNLVVSATSGVLSNDFDVDGDLLTAALVGNPSHGAITLNGDGSFTFVPTNNYNGLDAFTYQVTDGSATSAVATVTITIINDTPPVIICATNKTVECGSAWTFDAPTATSTCGTNVITVLSTTTNMSGHCGNTFDATRTWVATDECGNTNTCSQTVSVVDTTGPVITCATNKTVELGGAWTFDPPTASDGCGTNTITISSTTTNVSGHCGNTFDATRTWVATDACGNTNTCSQTVNVVDTTGPAITCATNKTVEIGAAWTFDAPTATDVGGTNTITVLSTSTNFSGHCGNTFDAARTWVATDECGNTNTCSQTVNVVDTTGPVITCATNKTVEIGAAWTFDAPTATDVGGTNVITVLSTTTNVSGHCGNTFDATRTWVATDECGNTNTCSQTVDVVDTIGPAITCVGGKNVECGNAWTFDIPSATDAGGTNVITVLSTTTNVSGHCGDTFEATRTWVATDECGNTNTCSQTVNVVDTTGPAITCATNKTVEIGAAWTFDPPTASDGCGTNTIAILSTTTNISGHCGNTFDATQTWVATDSCGNTNICSQTVSVVDTTGPAIICATNKNVEIGAAWTFDPPAATDVGGTNAITILSTTTNVSGHCGNTFDATRTWVATDECGNTNTCSQTVNVVDTDGPVITCATNKTIEIGAAWTFNAPTATDIGGTNTITIVSTTTNVSGHCGNTFDATRTWVATDACGNTNACSQTVNVVDTTGPVIICATNKTAECGSAWTFDAPSATDAGGTNTIAIVGTATNGGCGNTFVATRTWSATDLCGNSNTCSQTVTVTDTTGPAIICATNKNVEIGTAWTFDVPVAADGCGTNTIAIIGTVTNFSGHCGNTFDATRTWVATDACGNTNTCSQTVDVVDTTGPAITCATNKTVEIWAAWTFDTPTATDIGGTNTITILSTTTNFSGHCGNTFDATRTWVATDECGNTNTCAQTVNVVDTTGPAITCATNKTVECGSAWTFDAPSATDVGGTNTITIISTTTNATCGNTFAATRTWRATDLCGNSNTCSQTVTVTDTTAPAITCPANVEVSQFSQVPAPDPATATATDNCGPPAKSFVGDVAVTNGLVVTITRTYAAADACGNSNTCSQTITVTSLSADVVVAKSGPSTILAGSAITYTISVTNNGPSGATNVVVADNLPVNLVFSNASGGGVFSNGVVTWPITDLAAGEFTNYTLVATAPASGSFTNKASGTSSTPDPDPTNNNGTAVGGRVTTTAVTPTFGISAGAIVLNPQTGLYEQTVYVTNTTVIAVPGVRLNVTVSRSGVSLYNATGTNAGVPYVQYNFSLGSGEVLRFRLEFYNPSRLPFTDTFTAEAATGANATVSGGGVDIDRAFMDHRLSPTEIRFVIEFVSTPGANYTVVYSDEFPTVVWKVAVPSITANANRTQWYDDGPPKTDRKPSLEGGRYYRVIKN